MREIPLAIFNKSFSVHIRYFFWTYEILGLSKTFLSHSFSLSVNTFFGLPAFDWVGLMLSLNLFANV